MSDSPAFLKGPTEDPGSDWLSVGDEVLIIQPSYSRLPSSVYKAIVTKKSRTWAEFESDGTRSWRLRLDTQDDGTTSIRRVRWRTHEQYAFESALRDAHEYLKGQGIFLDFSSPWQKKEIELARLIWTAQN